MLIRRNTPNKQTSRMDCQGGQMSLKLVVVAFPHSAQDYGNSTRLARQCQFKYWLKIHVVQETRICELSPLSINMLIRRNTPNKQTSRMS